MRRGAVGPLDADLHRVAEAGPIGRPTGSPVPLASGEVIEARVAVWATSYEVPAGHRLRVSVSCADFPRILAHHPPTR